MADNNILAQYSNIISRYGRLIGETETQLANLRKEYQNYIVDRNNYVADCVSKELNKPVYTFPVHSLKRNKGISHITIYALNGGSVELNGEDAICTIDNNGYFYYRGNNCEIKHIGNGDIEYNMGNQQFESIIGYSDLIMQEEVHDDDKKEDTSSTNAEDAEDVSENTEEK